MERELFDRDTLLDLVVNFIPLGIILFFVGVYLFRQPWGFDLGISGSCSHCWSSRSSHWQY
ncbi:MAG: hypothetical protein J07HN6_01105 [Halonotius sp. J07HN6]|nr:MAG: hypothetical protein J07HN6_01105 [Halonotius sp. J07HN6]